jgi:hypothetical protein
MRTTLKNYNDLLRTTFIDIPTLEFGFIEIEDEKGKRKRIAVNQRGKFTRLRAAVQKPTTVAAG